MKNSYGVSLGLAWGLLIAGVCEVVSAIMLKFLSPVLTSARATVAPVLLCICVAALAMTLAFAMGAVTCAAGHAGATWKYRKTAGIVFWPSVLVILLLTPLTWLGSEIAWVTINAPHSTGVAVPLFDYIPYLFPPIIFAKTALILAVHGRRDFDTEMESRKDREIAAEADARESRLRGTETKSHAGGPIAAVASTALAFSPITRTESQISRDNVLQPVQPDIPKPKSRRELFRLAREEKIGALLRNERKPVDIISETGFPRSSTYKTIKELKDTPLGI
jgi:hypothetical protein